MMPIAGTYIDMKGGIHLKPALAQTNLMERWPSGQWQQTVNLPGQPYVGSNPTLSTILRETLAMRVFSVYRWERNEASDLCG
jgi:hypothetical protein